MKRPLTFAILPLAVAAIVVLCSGVTHGAIQMSVPGPANIFGAGHAVAPAPAGGGGGVLPPSYSFDAGSGKVLEFSSVTGIVWPIWPYFCGPDGYDTFPTDISSYGGISGIVHLGSNPAAMGTADQTGRALFLTGVFLDDNEPSVGQTPARLDFSYGADAFLTLAPEIGQTFFIGDGLTGTGSGSVQQFYVPETATRLFLGFADAGYFIGLPGAYGSGLDPFSDNGGWLTAEFNIVPEPCSLVLWSVLGVVGVGYGWRRKRRS